MKGKVDLYNDPLWNLHSKKEKMEKEVDELMKKVIAIAP